MITAPAPINIGAQFDNDVIASRLGAPQGAISTVYPMDLIDAGLRTLIIPLCDLATEISIFPKEDTLKKFCTDNSIDIVLIFSKETSKSGYIAHSRVFAPSFGYLEDPATGSGNSALGYYMLRNGIWDGSDCIIEQGGNDRVFNDIHLSQINSKVLFGGSATTRIDGVYYV